MASNRSTNNAPVSPAGAGGINRARQIANQGQSPIQQAQAIGGRTVAPSNPPQPPPSVLPPVAPVQYVQPGRVMNGSPAPYIPPIIHEPFVNPETPGESPVIISRPNPEYVRSIPPRPPKPTSPKTESIITRVVNEIIKESEEVVDEIITKQVPVKEPVDTKQDIVVPPAPITPTELVLEAQSNCEQIIRTPEINIEIINENIITVEASATASFEPTIKIQVEAFRPGCIDPDAINYDPDANMDNGSCKYEPIDEEEPVKPDTPPPPPPLEIPVLAQFVDSHGQVVFEVPKELVEMTEQKIDKETNLPNPGQPGGIITLPNGEIVTANLQLVKNIVRPSLEDSDIVFSLEDSVTADKKDIRNEVGGTLASDIKSDSEKDVIIMGDLEQLKDPLTRNNNGLIMMKTGDRPKLTISLRSQSFTYNQYLRSIDTKFTELIGRL